ncbi:hypothetical protein COT60_00340 [Candidatus Pacearchaeota archaeon CG09_land_8_20_14_0_10_30_9]|nr:LapA family protein [Candidatus Pacearchaeota archaeon]OIO40898.1 MAG: hypothetical protein AUJ61_00780 [Candidatus Pacearchaeota archaeon CG1_02_30_18]PIN71095.1 MAG: hypothetical protein COV77_03800 [Candidatus Pacearchaeota archaeon CG11_big_fil_rev_8_21_14_0_20_30_13]PIO01466.1 MAG: hypothetical protein COT60_00340 [Candidatus Pacearchaeota archaeon CG09_land_8_20_14_0_10_30_9]PIZ81640.1 MAG: hypothetical protein COX98_03045 [Candidatus Pacearchaeota archaeon CG_4_10_14_0_2_um_filter_30_
MNFRLTSIKIIISLIFGILGFFFWRVSWAPGPGPFGQSILVGIIVLIVVYLIFSLIQKKK